MPIKKIAGVLAALALLLTGCGDRPDEGGGDGSAAEGYASSVELDPNFDPDAEVVFAWSLEATSWDPHRGVSDYDLTMLFPVYDRLIMVDPDGEMLPMLATSWESTETDITLQLRDGLSFSDGAAFDAAAVKANLDRARSDDLSLITEHLSTITNVEVVDDLTVRIDINGKPGLVLGMLTARAGMMVSPAAFNDESLHTQPVGIGAYQASAIVPGSHVRFERTDGYWDPDAQRVAAMTYRYMPEAQTAVNAVLSGDAHIASVSADRMGAFSDDFTLIAGGFSSMDFIELNNTFEPFADPKVRLAMNMAIDRQGISEGLSSGLCVPTIQPWPASSFAYDEQIGDGSEVWPYDPEQAKELLAEAGYPDGFTFKAITSTVSHYGKLSEVLQEQFAQVGITMEFEIAPRPQMVEQFSTNKTVPAMVAANPAHVDPEYTNGYVFAAGSVNNPGDPLPQNMFSLLAEAANEPDQDTRADLYSQFMTLAVEEPTHFMPVCNALKIYAMDSGISGVATYASSVRDLRGIAYTP